ncbi:MAG: hypothetical protein R2932_10190 [Caldilineaceae bacterium]
MAKSLAEILIHGGIYMGDLSIFQRRNNDERSHPEPILMKEEPFAAFLAGVLNAVGVPEEDGRIVADCLLTTNLSGIDSHGVVR